MDSFQSSRSQLMSKIKMPNQRAKFGSQDCWQNGTCYDWQNSPPAPPTHLVPAHGDLDVPELCWDRRLCHLDGLGITQPHENVGDVTLELSPLSDVLLQLLVLDPRVVLQVAPPLKHTCVRNDKTIGKSASTVLLSCV